MIKIKIRSIFDNFARFSGLLQCYEKRMKGRLTILMYHRVLPGELCKNYPLQSLVIPSEVFNAQMEYLAENYTVLPISEALMLLNNKESTKKPIVSVTFDDGYEDNYTIAAPILEKIGVKGTFFITSGFVIERSPQWFDRAALLNLVRNDSVDISVWMENLKRMPSRQRMDFIEKLENSLSYSLDYSNFLPMTKKQIKELDDRGHEIASHTVSHQIVTQLDNETLVRELDDSAAAIQSWIGHEITGFCYPNGNHDLRVEEAVARAGYKYACTTEEGVNDNGTKRFRLLRLPVTMHRTMLENHFDILGFRAEICRVRSFLRLGVK